MTIVEQAAYFKGLAEGLNMENDSREGKLWGALTTLLSDMAHEIEDLQADSLDTAELLDDLGDEVRFLEELAMGLDEDFDDEDDDFLDEDEPGRDYRPDLRLYQADEDEDEDEEADYDGVLYDVTCPSCGQEISFDESTLDAGAINCPSCGEMLEFDLGEDDEE